MGIIIFFFLSPITISPALWDSIQNAFCLMMPNLHPKICIRLVSFNSSVVILPSTLLVVLCPDSHQFCQSYITSILFSPSFSSGIQCGLEEVKFCWLNIVFLIVVSIITQSFVHIIFVAAFKLKATILSPFHSCPNCSINFPSKLISLPFRIGFCFLYVT